MIEVAIVSMEQALAADGEELPAGSGEIERERLMKGAGLLGVYRASGPAISWSLAPATAGADVVRVGAIVVGTIMLSMLFSAGSAQWFRKRPPDQLAVRTAAE